MNVQTLKWKLSGTAEQQPEKFVTMDLETDKLLYLWGGSIVSFEWLKEGRPKSKENLSDGLRERFEECEKALLNNKEIEQPLLGVGIFNGVEIGTGRATLCVFAAHKVPTIKCSIMKSMEKEFMKLWKKG